MPRRRNARPGFTLVEVVAALVLAGFVLSGGVLLFKQLDDEAGRIRRESIAVSRAGNGDRVLHVLLGHAESNVDTTKRFRGDEHGVAFRSWCAVPSAWLERCGVLLTIGYRTDSSALVAQLSTGEQLVLLVRPGPMALRYVDLARRDSAWVVDWGKTLTLPTAVALVRETDTIVIPVGAARD